MTKFFLQNADAPLHADPLRRPDGEEDASDEEEEAAAGGGGRGAAAAAGGFFVARGALGARPGGPAAGAGPQAWEGVTPEQEEEDDELFKEELENMLSVGRMGTV